MKTTNRRHPIHPVIKAFVQPKIKFIYENIELTDKTLLDVGCGNGFFTYHFAELCDVTGLDISEKMLKTNPHNKLVLGNVECLPFDNDYFDIVFCSNLLHHLDNPEKAIREMKRVAKEYIIISEPNKRNPFIYFFHLIKKDERRLLKLNLKKIYRDLTLIKSFCSGFVFPNACPKSLLFILKKLDFNQYFGGYITIIFKK